MRLLSFGIVLVVGILCMIQLSTINAMAEPVYTYLYVGEMNSQVITVFDPVTLSKVTDIKVGGSPYDVVINPAGTLLFVSYSDQKYIDVYSTIDYTLIKRVATTGYVARLSINSNGDKLYGTTYLDNDVFLLDLSTFTITHSVTIDNAYQISYYNGYVYVGTLDTSTVLYKLSPTTLATISSITGAVYSPWDMVLYPTYNRLYIANSNGTVTDIALSTFTVNGVYQTGTTDTVTGISINSTGFLFAGIGAADQVAVFDPYGTLVTNISISSDSYITDALYNPYNRTLYLSSSEDNKLYIVNPDTGATVLSGYIGEFPYVLYIGTQAHPAEHQVKFVVQSLFGIIKYTGATVAIYDNSGVFQNSKESDTTGQAAFYLQPTISYTLWVHSEKDNINISYPIVPYDDTYYVEVVPFIQSWNPLGWIQNTNQWTGAGTGNVNKDIRITNTINTTASPRKMTVNYTDATASTSSINFTLLRYWYDNHTYTTYNTTIVAGSSIGSRQMPFTIPANLADGQSWRLVVTSETVAYGTVMRSDDYRFPGASYPIPGLPASWYPYICFAFTVIVALMFTYISTGLGLIVIAALNILFMGMGWLAWSDVYLLLMQVLAVFGAGQIFKMRKQREGV